MTVHAPTPPETPLRQTADDAPPSPQFVYVSAAVSAAPLTPPASEYSSDAENASVDAAAATAVTAAAAAVAVTAATVKYDALPTKNLDAVAAMDDNDDDGDDDDDDDDGGGDNGSEDDDSGEDNVVSAKTATRVPVVHSAARHKGR